MHPNGPREIFGIVFHWRGFYCAEMFKKADTMPGESGGQACGPGDCTLHAACAGVPHPALRDKPAVSPISKSAG